ncbi:MAG: XRE family transcriptional regulator [Chloroflexi bacterium]|nr:XRE family transcriptional regulator [Chloroflexota bacterium]
MVFSQYYDTAFWVASELAKILPAEAVAVKRVIAFQIGREMQRRKLTKTAMAGRMNTSRAALERLLDPTNTSITLSTLERAALALGKKLKVELA